ncbi:MAG TPA: hypothetical protein VML55_21445 [Planctomycetaceae bacterium]|nr:hypothetical protein [Planctomycetaceae bacterium]
MRKFLVVVIVLAICVVGFGFYRGWFAFSSPDPAAGSDTVNINLATDKDKMKDDAQAVKDKAAELTGNSADEAPDSASEDVTKEDDAKSNDE